MNIRDRLFIVVGSDYSQRSRAIESIKQKINIPQALTLTFYAKEIKLNDFQEKVLTFSFAKAKIIILRQALVLAAPVKNFLYDNFKKILPANYIILEIDKDYSAVLKNKKIAKDKFFSFVFQNAAVFRLSGGRREVTVDDFRASIRRNDVAQAIYVVEQLFVDSAKERSLAPFLLGVLGREVSYCASGPQRQRKLHYLWETDRAIKEKGVSPRLAIELLLTRLFCVR